MEFASVALFLTWRGLHLTLDLVNEGRNECEIRTCGLLGVLEVEAWGRRRHSFKGIRNTLQTCNSGTFQRVRWHGSIYTCPRSQTTPQSSFPVFLYMRLYPSDTYPLFPLSYVAWSPLPSLVLIYISGPLAKPLPMTDSISVLTIPSGRWAFGQKLTELWHGVLLGQVTFSLNCTSTFGSSKTVGWQ